MRFAPVALPVSASTSIAAAAAMQLAAAAGCWPPISPLAICAPGSSQTTHCLESPPRASLLCVLVAHPFLIHAAPNSPPA